MPIEPSDCVTQELLDIWIENRTRIGGKKFKWTPGMETAWLNRCRELHILGYDLPAAINWQVSTGNNWLTIYPREEHKRQKRPNYHQNTGPATILLVDREKGREALKTVLKAIK